MQSDDYYPFGLTFNSYQRENSKENKWRFQGQEHIDDLGLGWDQFKWRNHQPDIGRFFNVDPLAEKYYYNSVYAFSENRVIDAVELEGLEADVLYARKPEDQIIIDASDDISNSPNVLTIVSHAGPHGARVVENNEKGGLIDGPKSFNTQMTKDSEKWRKRDEIGNLVVVMFGCNLARDRTITKKDDEGNIIEEERPTRIQGISAGHPNQVFIGGETSVVYKDYGLWDEISGPEDGGHWRVYKAGKLIDEYPSSWNPNQYKSEWFDSPKEIESKSAIPPATGSHGNTTPDSNKKIK